MTGAHATGDAATQPAGPLEAFENSWRYKLGLALIIGGHLILLLGLLLPALGVLSAGGAAMAVVVGEVVGLASIVFLGKQGFLAIKSKFVGAIRAEFARPVGRSRHTIGIVLLLSNFFASVTLAAFAWASYEVAPGEIVWGMSLEEQADFYATLFAAGELAFPVGIVVLGADWWERFRGLFVWPPPSRD